MPNTTNNFLVSYHTLRFLAGVLACLFAVASPLLAQHPAALVTQPVDNSVRTVLTGNVHPLARPQYDQGEAPSDLVLHRMLLVLKRSPQQETALRSLIENQQYKKSPSYHQWLTPAEFGAKFGAAESDIAAVTNWLGQSGFQVTQVSNGRTVIEFTGTAGQVKQAFGTAIHKYLVNGEQHWANVNDPSIPMALAPVVAGFNSLHNFLKKPQHVRVGTYSEKTRQLTKASPEFTTSGNAECLAAFGTCYAVSPYDFATIYDVLPLWNNTPTAINGAGQTIAIVARTNINPSDATTFWSLFGLDGTNAPQPTLHRIYNGPDPGIIDADDEAEADIDSQWSGAVAPGATIDFVISESTETDDGVDLSALYIVDNNLAPVMSESFGTCEASLGAGGVGYYSAIWEQAAAQGITAMVSTGDSGAAGCDDANGGPAENGLAINGIASSWFNVAVGGTDFNQGSSQLLAEYWNSTNAATTLESAKGYIPETTWNASCSNLIFEDAKGGSTNQEANCNNSAFSDFFDPVGGGGGASEAWLKPTWQTGTGVPNDSARDVPDVSLFASSGFLQSFYVICQSDQTGGVCDENNLQGYGGTSVASPAFAGIMALVNQKTASAQGNANLVLYKLAAVSGANAFHDIPSGSTNAMPCLTNSPNCVTNTSTDANGILSGWNTTTGFDLATGLGSVDAANLVNKWDDATYTPTTTTLTLSVPANTVHGTAVPVTVSVSPSGATGDVSLLVAPKPGTPGIDWNTLSNGTISWSSTLLPGGTYQVIAHYGGDSNYNGSYSSPSASITIHPEASIVVMPGVDVGADSNNNPEYSQSVTYGSGQGVSYWLRADVYNSQDEPCTTETFVNNSNQGIPCPTGTITFKDNGANLDASPYKLNSFGYTEDQTIQLTGGSHTLVANYGGDASYSAASSTPVVVTVAKATTAITASAPPSALSGAQFTATASVTTTSYGAAPTGTVQFFYGSTLLGTATLSGTAGNAFASVPTYASLAATLSTASISTPGVYAITAVYSGDGNYTGITSTNPVSITIPSPFALSNPGTSHTVLAGQSTLPYTFTVTPTGALVAPIAFSLSGLPANASYQFSPTSIPATTSTQTTVTLTITTTGPNTGTGSQGIRADNRAPGPPHNRVPWLPLSLPLAGVVMVGLARRRISKHAAIAGLCFTLALLGLLLACGGGSSSTPPPITVSVSGTPTSVYPNNTADAWPAQTAQFTATVSNTTNTAVTWSVSPSSNGGTISATGLYTAPTVAAGLPTSVTITATSTANTAISGTATETLNAATIPGPYTPITVTATEGGSGGIVKQSNVTLVVQ